MKEKGLLKIGKPIVGSLHTTEYINQCCAEYSNYSNKSFRILLFVFVFGPFLNFEYYSNIRIIASEYYEYLKLFVLYFFVDIVNFKFKS